MDDPPSTGHPNFFRFVSRLRRNQTGNFLKFGNPIQVILCLFCKSSNLCFGEKNKHRILREYTEKSQRDVAQLEPLKRDSWLLAVWWLLMLIPKQRQQTILGSIKYWKHKTLDFILLAKHCFQLRVATHVSVIHNPHHRRAEYLLHFGCLLGYLSAKNHLQARELDQNNGVSNVTAGAWAIFGASERKLTDTLQLQRHEELHILAAIREVV